MVSEQEIYRTLTAIFRETFKSQHITLHPELSAEDVNGWDSFKKIEIMLAIEVHYGFEMRIREMNALRTVGELVRLIATRTSSAGHDPEPAKHGGYVGLTREGPLVAGSGELKS